MASVVSRPNGDKWIQFKGHDGKRRTLRLGAISKEQATTVKQYVVALLNAKRLNVEPSEMAVLWLSGVDVKMRKRLAAVGLCEYKPAVSLSQLVADFMAAKSFRASTRRNVEDATRNLLAFFGADFPIANFNTADGERFKRHLERNGSKQGAPLSAASVSRRFRRCQQLLAFAVKDCKLDDNPFENIGSGREVNRDRDFFVTVEMTEKLLEQLTPELAAVVALMRYGGMRYGETRLFTWGAVDWDEGSVRVENGKTGTRVIPLFSPLKKWLSRCKQGDPAFPNYHGKSSGWLTKKVRDAIDDAGLKRWPKLFQNLRATRATELRDNGVPSAVAAMWLGHSEGIADGHYVQVASHHYETAVDGGYESGCKIRSK